MKMENMRSQIGGGTEEYQKPQMEIVELSGENVIVTSCTPNTSCTPPDVPDYDDWLG